MHFYSPQLVKTVSTVLLICSQNLRSLPWDPVHRPPQNSKSLSLEMAQFILIHMTRSVQKVPSHVIWKVEPFIEEDTRNIVHRTMTPQFKVGTLGPHTASQSPLAALSFFPASHRQSKSLPFQRWFEFGGKPEVSGRQIWAVVGLSHLGDLMFCQKTLHETWCMSGSIVMRKLPITSCP